MVALAARNRWGSRLLPFTGRSSPPAIPRVNWWVPARTLLDFRHSRVDLHAYKRSRASCMRKHRDVGRVGERRDRRWPLGRSLPLLSVCGGRRGRPPFPCSLPVVVAPHSLAHCLWWHPSLAYCLLLWALPCLLLVVVPPHPCSR